jgi:hypothetical protein
VDVGPVAVDVAFGSGAEDGDFAAFAPRTPEADDGAQLAPV